MQFLLSRVPFLLGPAGADAVLRGPTFKPVTLDEPDQLRSNITEERHRGAGHPDHDPGTLTLADLIHPEDPETAAFTARRREAS